MKMDKTQLANALAYLSLQRKILYEYALTGSEATASANFKTAVKNRLEIDKAKASQSAQSKFSIKNLF